MGETLKLSIDGDHLFYDGDQLVLSISGGAMASQTDICNLALHHLGMRGITAITDDDPSAEACNLFWTPCRDDVFSEFCWPFAKARALLSELDEDQPGWDYVYSYPSNAAAIWCVYDELSVDNRWEQAFEVLYLSSSNLRVICTNLEDAYAEYSYKVTDTTLWSPKFVMAMSYRLAAEIAHQLTGNIEIGQKMMDVFNAMIQEAKRIMAYEKVKQPTITSGYKSARG